MLVRLMILGAAAWLLFRIIRRVLAAAGARDTGKFSDPRGSVDDMVQDPVCGTYVPIREAHRSVIDGKIYYFCSERCADLFKEQRRRRTS